MSELRDILDIAAALQTPLLSFVAWLVWRIYSNHLPHIKDQLIEVEKRIAHLEGVHEGLEAERKWRK